jgi:hypothetical protein
MSTGADINGDYKLDILVLGEETYVHHKVSLFKNISSNNNTPPNPPESLTTKLEDDDLLLEWTSGNDAETSINGLRYNVYIIHDQDTVVQPYSLPSGERVLVNNGNAQNNLFFKLKNPKSGIYKWRVQSIDQSFIGSAFSNEETFEVNRVTSISEEFYNIEKVKAFPNPFNSEINISQEQPKFSVSITLTDIEGKEIYKIDRTRFPCKITTSELQSGMYLLIIKNGPNVTVSKVIKN